MKDGKNGSPDKPFYQNILDEKAKRKEKAKATAEARKARKAASGVGKETGDRNNGAGPGFAARRDGPARGRPGTGTYDRRTAPRDSAPHRSYARFTPPETGSPVFAGLSEETKKLLDGFPELVQSVMPLDSRKLHGLPADIRELSHELTDERSERRVGYMNEPPVLSAYIRYYMWWNLVRLTRLFSGVPIALEDGDAAVDLGSGPLTLPIALWMSRPELRAKKLTWYCVDLSQNALAAGEEIFLSLAAKTGNEPWQIVRIKGELGVSLRRRVRLVASANMFNELFWDDPDPIEAQAKRHAKSLASYAEETAAVLLIEPGVPLAGRFVSLMRDSLIRLGFRPSSPCPHEGVCPFPGLRGGKWCHFVFDTADAPKALHKLSEDAGLPKDRAALSFVYALRDGSKPQPESVTASESADTASGDSPEGDNPAAIDAGDAVSASPLERVSLLAGRFGVLPVRIASDPIRLPDYRTGRYGCSEMGMVLVTGSGNAGKWLADEAPETGSPSGSLLRLTRPAGKRPDRDEKTGAILIALDGGSFSRESAGGRDRETGGPGRDFKPRDREPKPHDREYQSRDREPRRPEREYRPREGNDNRPARGYAADDRRGERGTRLDGPARPEREPRRRDGGSGPNARPAKPRGPRPPRRDGDK